VVYLAPALDDAPDEIRVAVIAHELAHVALEHQLTGPREGQEDEVFRTLCGWGFRQEAEAHQELRRERRRRVERGLDP
jgi:predicted Zn-dependent protease